MEDQRTGSVQFGLVSQHVQPGQTVGVKTHVGYFVSHVQAQIVTSGAMPGVDERRRETLSRRARRGWVRGGGHRLPATQFQARSRKVPGEHREGFFTYVLQPQRAHLFRD